MMSRVASEAGEAAVSYLLRLDGTCMLVGWLTHDDDIVQAKMMARSDNNRIPGASRYFLSK